MRIGFTGTQDGMTDAQKVVLYEFLDDWFVEGAEFNHGNCVGADEQAAIIANQIGYVPVAYPSDIPNKQSNFNSSWIAQPPKPPLDRNKDIVKASPNGMFATPKQYQMVMRSGTWSTVRYALRTAIPVIIVWPDGRFKEMGNGA